MSFLHDFCLLCAARVAASERSAVLPPVVHRWWLLGGGQERATATSGSNPVNACHPHDIAGDLLRVVAACDVQPRTPRVARVLSPVLAAAPTQGDNSAGTQQWTWLGAVVQRAHVLFGDRSPKLVPHAPAWALHEPQWALVRASSYLVAHVETADAAALATCRRAVLQWFNQCAMLCNYNPSERPAHVAAMSQAERRAAIALFPVSSASEEIVYAIELLVRCHCAEAMCARAAGDHAAFAAHAARVALYAQYCAADGDDIITAIIPHLAGGASFDSGDFLDFAFDELLLQQMAFVAQHNAKAVLSGFSERELTRALIAQLERPADDNWNAVVILGRLLARDQ